MFGKILLTLDALGLILGAPIADMTNNTHVYNPRWPPHAKFHGAQTITLSVILGFATLYYTWRPSLTAKDSKAKPADALAAAERERDSLRTAAFTGSIYWLAGLASILFPGTDGLDPEFGGPGFPQAPVFTTLMCMGLAGAMLEGMGKR